MKLHHRVRLLSLVLAAVMVLGLLPGADAAPAGLRWKRSHVPITPDLSDRLIPQEVHTPDEFRPTDLVRVSIVLEDEPTLRSGFCAADISSPDALAYDRSLRKTQEQLARTISRQALGGKPLDVVWNLTLAVNILSANVPYGSIDAIRSVEGVRDVVLERSYRPSDPEALQPNTHSSSAMIGADEVWESGLTGAGSRIAVIDTGTDTDHQSFNNDAFLYALEQTGKDLSSLDLLDIPEINDVLKRLNITERIGFDDGSSYYLSEKLPFAANYVDRNLTVDHDDDYQGSHGSHVAGIAAANRYIPKDGAFVPALDTVRMSGVAPDAQIITLKVFGNADGPFDSDYFAAIEDAIVLGCDSVNLSLGLGVPGSSENMLFAELLDYLATTETVVVMSAGNSGSWADETAAGRLYSDGISFHTAGEPGTYTNSLAAASVDNDSIGDSGSFTMSSFSSWGVPGSLELKPELTAPGGRIRSVNGMDPDGDAYEIMSGTSMAAPQISGMAALAAQYIRERGLDQKTGLSVRHLAQSLLMSTAVPLIDAASGGYYSILNQGAGLARVDLAVGADSLVLVEGMPDGKVKAELGEDPLREGVYRLRFSIRDLSGAERTYALSADLFTQALLEEDGTCYLDTATRPLDADVSFSGTGVVREDSGYTCDLNGDGVTNAMDADHLLEYIVGNAPTLHAEGDVDADGDLDTHDAHILLPRLNSGSYSVTVPADGAVTIDVTLALSSEARALLDRHYPTGAYIEAFLKAEPLPDAQGRRGSAHSIPVLGFYGSWTDPGMYDVGSYLEHSAGTENRTPYLYQYNDIRSNYLTIDPGDGREYLFGGNPYIQEEEYLPRRNAFSNSGNASLRSLRFTLIRSARASMLVLKDADTGEVHLAQELGAWEGAYYHANLADWQNTQWQLPLGLWLDGIPEGTTLDLSLIAAPELYCTYDAETGAYTADWDRLGAGAYLSTTFTIDNTAPELLDLELVDGGTLRITARDNQYIAAAALLNPSGTQTLAAAPANQTEPNAEMTVELDLSGIYGKTFLLAVYDYAQNHTVHEVTLDLSSVRPALTGCNRSQPGYVGLEADGSAMPLAPADDRAAPQAAEYVEGMVYEITEDGALYLGSDGDLFSFTFLRDLDPDDRWEIFRFLDLAYSRSEGRLYGLFYSDRNQQDAPYLFTIDLYSGQMSVLGEMPIDAVTLAIDDAGSFYSAVFGASDLYTYTADVIQTGKTSHLGKMGSYRTTEVTSMAWDHDADRLYWAVNTKTASTLVTIDPKTAAASHVASYSFPICGLYLAYEPDETVFAPSEKVDAVTMDAEAYTLVRNTVRLQAKLWPWNVHDNGIIWTSDAPEIASVSPDGTVLGISAGQAVITAASRMDPAKTASCTVTVSSLDRALNALVWDEEGSVWWSRFHADTLPQYQMLSSADQPFNATMVADGQLYASTLDITWNLSDLYRVDPVTFAAVKVGSASISYADLAYSPSLGCGLGVCNGYVVLIDLQTGDYSGAWSWNDGRTADLVGITYYTTVWNETYRTNADLFLLLDADGNVYREAWLRSDNGPGYFYGPELGYVTNIGPAVDYACFQGFHFDGEYVYWTRFSEAENSVELIVWDSEETGQVYSMGRFPDRVWPVGGLYTDISPSGSAALADEALSTASIRPADLMAALPAGTAAPLHRAEAASDGTAVLEITLPSPAPNGLLEISYDPDMLELTAVSAAAEAFAWNSEPGLVRLAAADRYPFPAESTLASLHLKAKGEGTTKLTVTTTQLGMDPTLIEEPVTLTLPHICPSEGFVDVNPGDWWHEAVDYVVTKGYMNGMDAAHYGPAATMNRAQFVTVLYRMEGQPEVDNTGVFTDVPAGQFYTNAAYWALSAGITTGATATTFNPRGRLTRTELVTFMYRYAKRMGYDTAPGDLSAYRDAGNVLPFAVEPWGWAVSHGIVTGMSADTLAPMDLTNRAQAAIIFQRFDDRLAK